MTPADALAQVRAAGVEVALDGGELRLRAPPGALTHERLDWLRAHRGALVEALRTASDPLVELYRVAFDPLKEISFISDEYNKFELEGSLLADSTKPFDAVLGQFGRIVQL